MGTRGDGNCSRRFRYRSLLGSSDGWVSRSSAPFVAIVNAYLDEKLTKPRLFLAICAVAVASGGALTAYLDARKAQAEARQFQSAVQVATGNLLSKADEISGCRHTSPPSQNAELSRAVSKKSDVIANPGSVPCLSLARRYSRECCHLPALWGAACNRANVHSGRGPDDMPVNAYVEMEMKFTLL